MGRRAIDKDAVDVFAICQEHMAGDTYMQISIRRKYSATFIERIVRGKTFVDRPRPEGLKEFLEQRDAERKARKITPQKIWDMCLRRMAGLQYKEIAPEFGYSSTFVGNVVTGQYFPNVPRPEGWEEICKKNVRRHTANFAAYQNRQNNQPQCQ